MFSNVRSGKGLDLLAGRGLINPWIGLAPCIFYLFIEYVRPMAWIPLLGAVRPGMIAVLWGFFALLFSANKRRLPSTAKWILAFTALLFYQIPMADNHLVALQKLQLDFLPLLLGLVLPLSVLPNSVRGMKILLTAFFIVHLPTALHGVRNLGTGIGGWFGDENDLAFALNVAVGVGCYLFIETRVLTRKLWIVAGLGLLISSTVISFSRGGLLGLAAVTVYLFLTAKQFRKPILALAVIGVIAVFAFASDDWKAEMGTISTAAEADDTGGQRLYFWELGWRMFLDHPITGVGTENFGHHTRDYEDRERYGSLWRRVAHSLYFTLIPEHGLVGIFIFCGLLLSCLRGHRRLQRRFQEEPENETRRTAALLSSGLAAAMVAVLATGTFLSVLYYPPLWIIAAMMGSITATADAEDEAEREAAEVGGS